MKVFIYLSIVFCASALSLAAAEEPPMRHFSLSLLGLGHSPGDIVLLVGEEQFEIHSVPLNRISDAVEFSTTMPLRVLLKGADGRPGKQIASLDIPETWQDVLIVITSSAGDVFYAYPMNYSEADVPQNSVVLINFTNAEMAAKIDDKVKQVKPGLNSVESLGPIEGRRFINLRIALQSENDWNMLTSRRLAMLKDSRMLAFVHFFKDEQDIEGRWLLTPIRQGMSP